MVGLKLLHNDCLRPCLGANSKKFGHGVGIMRPGKFIAGVFVGAVLAFTGAALAQQTMLIGGSWTTNHVPVFGAQNVNGNPLLLDSGLTAGSSPTTIVASLPTCSSANKGQLYTVTDASSPTYGTTLTGGSTTTALALCTGAVWSAH